MMIMPCENDDDFDYDVWYRCLDFRKYDECVSQTAI